MFFLQLGAASGGQRGGSASRGPSLTLQLWAVVSLWGPQGLGQGGRPGSWHVTATADKGPLSWVSVSGVFIVPTPHCQYPYLPPSVGAHHRLLKAAYYQPREPCFGPVWASLPFSVHSLCRHQFRVRVTTLIKATASVCVHVSLLLTLNRPLLGDLGLPISENRGTDLVKISASPSHAPGLGFRRTIWTECMPAHSLQVCPRGRCSEQGETGEETGMAKCPSLPPG